MIMVLVSLNLVLDVLITFAIIWICCHVHSKVDLPSNLVLLSIEDKVALTETSGHPTDILNTLPILLPIFVRLNELVLHVHKDPHLLGIRIVFVVVELDCIRMLHVPLLVLTLLHLVFQGSLFSLFLAAVTVFVERLLHFRDQSGLDQFEVLVDNHLNVLDSSDQEVLVSNTVFNTNAESVQGFHEQSLVRRIAISA
jgi:hypothetical protein